MPKPFDFSLLSNQLRTQLMARGTLSAGEALEVLSVSQATYSRLIEKMKPSLLIFGKARKTRYALRRTIPAIGAHTALYGITENGRPLHLGNLHFVEPRGFFLEPKHAGLNETHYPDLPFFLEDLRPSGFLGRLVPRAHPELGAPLDILNWSANDCLRYWTALGWNLVGNLVVGETALQKFLELHQNPQTVVSEPDSPASFPKCALRALEQGNAGSSAGGEQPKFTIDAKPDEPAALVKFSPKLTNPIGRRVGDLLVCEHLCHEILAAHGFPSAKSKVLDVENQVFLRVERFDRVGALGRRGVISLKALSLEFVGSLESWTEIGLGLLEAGLIDDKACERIRVLERFGELIGNNDMHAGNLSFHLRDDLRPGELAPIYDMLPMMYFPRQNELMERTYAPKLPIPQEAVTWRQASSMALRFWEQVAQDPRVSAGFRDIASKNRDVLKRQIDLAAQLF